MSRRASPYFEETPPSFANNSIHAPLHSERGWGRGSLWLLVRLFVAVGEAVFPILITIPYISKACILCYKKNIVNLQRTILLYHVRTYRHP